VRTPHGYPAGGVLDGVRSSFVHRQHDTVSMIRRHSDAVEPRGDVVAKPTQAREIGR
jgi:hypothetical protein